MLGAIIGDMVGSRFEFNNTNKTDFELFTDESTYTDDTICTIAIADATMNNKSYKQSLLEWCRKYPNPKGGYGASFARWIKSKDPQPYNSYGNGSAMRVSPVAWLFNRYPVVTSYAKLTATPSHSHILGEYGAMCVAGLIFKLRTGEIDKSGVEEYISEYNYSLSSVQSIRMHNQFNETCQVTIPQAVSCFMEAESFEETIRLAVSIGGDSDTIAAIAGSIAESIYTIPDEIGIAAIDRLPDDMFDIFDQFLNTSKEYYKKTMFK